MTFKEIAPFVIAATLMVSILIIKVKKKEILTKDGIFSIMGFGLGLVITFLNLIFSNIYLIALGPILVIASILYLRFKNEILTDGMDSDHYFHNKILKTINILYWLSISIALISYQQAPPYYRPPIFFISISFGAALLGLEIISSRYKDNFKIIGVIFKIILISLILRASAYFISPYPVGSDPWGHADLIKDILNFGTVNVPPTPISVYYSNYPLMHIYAVVANLIGNLSIKESMFIIGTVMVLSTVFVYLIVAKITRHNNLALLSMLMLNFADFHIQWSIEVIAMSFGIAIYTILLYLILEKNEKHQISYTIFLILFFFIIIWTHTVSAFISLVSIISIYVGSLLYPIIYKKKEGFIIGVTFCMIFMVILLVHWMDPNYLFFQGITSGLINSLSSDVKVLQKLTVSNIEERWEMILNILGFLIYIFFGIIGSLSYLSKKCTNMKKFSLVFMIIVLYFIFFLFPVIGLKNIVPQRWPAFIYSSFVLFVGIGLMGSLRILKGEKSRTVVFITILFVSSLVMITNFVSDMDSPIWEKENIGKLIWTESEISLSKKINSSFDGIIISDLQTGVVLFETYLQRPNINIKYFRLTSKEDIDYEYMNNKLIVWRKMSLSRPVTVDTYPRVSNMLLGTKFKTYLDKNFSCIYDTGEARACLRLST